MPTLDARGRVTLPPAVREGLGLRTGGPVVWVPIAEGWVLQRAADEAAAAAGHADVTRSTTRNTGRPGSG